MVGDEKYGGGGMGVIARARLATARARLGTFLSKEYFQYKNQRDFFYKNSETVLEVVSSNCRAGIILEIKGIFFVKN